jgi:hypothetical protein
MDWVDEDTHAEWVDGEIEVSQPVTYQHQAIRSFWVAFWAVIWK